MKVFYPLYATFHLKVEVNCVLNRSTAARISEFFEERFSIVHIAIVVFVAQYNAPLFPYSIPVSNINVIYENVVFESILAFSTNTM